jgi:hypothetical protein
LGRRSTEPAASTVVALFSLMIVAGVVWNFSAIFSSRLR